MIVYGDPSIQRPLGAYVERLLSRLDAPPEWSLDDLRTFLVQAGQLEQAIEDGLRCMGRERAKPAATRLTEAAARAFLAAWAGTQSDLPFQAPDLETELARARQSLLRMPASTAKLSFKFPEGFSFYALFPESYCVSALKWASDHEVHKGQRVLVAGVRSIGTTLSALVKTVLELCGWDVSRITVRPTGDPFNRTLPLDDERFREIDWCLVVDEGPGLSGSSMAAVAHVAHCNTVPKRRIHFFPGHAGQPGQYGSERIRDWWQTAPRYVTSTDELRWNGKSLTECLGELTPGEATSVTWLGPDQWRTKALPDPLTWPPVAAPFERPKYLAQTKTGSSVIWKFLGILAEECFERLQRYHRFGWGPEPVGCGFGFVALRWVEGERLTQKDLTPDLLQAIADYIAMAEKPISPRETWQDSLRWISRANANALLNLNLEFGLGSAGDVSGGNYGDGRLSPHEWVMTDEGRLVKTGTTGLPWDHTAVGPQPVSWDIAGAIVEWNMSEEQRREFSLCLERAGLDWDVPLQGEHLKGTYAAFRAGQCAMCAEMTQDPEEAERLRKATEFYKVWMRLRLAEFEATNPLD